MISEPIGNRRVFYLILFVAILVSHLPTFFASHKEYDELVYLTLSQRMNWDLTSYNLQGVLPKLMENTPLYNSNVFLHPPLFPLFIKAFSLFLKPDFAALLLNTVLQFLLGALTYRFSRKTLQLAEPSAQLSAFFLVICPILGFTSTRVLTDTLFTLGITGTLFCTADLERTKDRTSLLGAVLFLSLAMNTKFQGVLFLPFFGALWARRLLCSRSSLATMRTIGPAMILLAIGLQHYVRVLLEYGIFDLLPLWSKNSVSTPFVERVARRSFPLMALFILLIEPFLACLFSPQFWINQRSELKKRPELRVLLGFLGYTIPLMALSFFNQERYWAPILPALFCLCAWRLERSAPATEHSPLSVRHLVAFGVASALITFYLVNILQAGDQTALVYPGILTVIPEAILDIAALRRF